MNSAGRRKRGPRASRRFWGRGSQASLAEDSQPADPSRRSSATMALPVGGGRDDLFDEALHVPAVLHEIDGEPVEQFGVARLLALRAEVGGGGDEAGAEEDLPEAIHLDARGERVLAHRDPVGEAEAVGRHWRASAPTEAGAPEPMAAGSTAGVPAVTFSVGCA